MIEKVRWQWSLSEGGLREAVGPLRGFCVKGRRELL